MVTQLTLGFAAWKNHSKEILPNGGGKMVIYNM